MSHADNASVARRTMLWWFAPPYSAYVSASGIIEFSTALAYLEQLAQQPGARVSVQHLVSAAITRVLQRYPIANARIMGGRIVRQPHVGLAMPVNLIGHNAGKSSELSMLVIPKAETLSLRGLAERCRKDVSAEREGKRTNPFLSLMFQIAQQAPLPVFYRTMDSLDRLMQNPRFAERVLSFAPVTTGITNPGAVFNEAGASGEGGVWFRGVAVSLPQRLVHVGTLWGISAIQQEVVPIHGKPEVRPVLPLALIFDHRLVDGVMAGRLLMALTEILRDPAAVFGPDGSLAPAPVEPKQ